MISKKLIEDITPHLKEAEEIWVAVALMKENTFLKLQQMLPIECKQHYVVGIDLPTAPSVLKKLKENISEIFSALVFNQNTTFHPKVYVIRKGEKLTAFIGSANATEGGFKNNIELSYKINSNEDCLKILDWFKELSSTAQEITDDFIEEYKTVFRKNKYYSSIQKSNTDKLKGLSESIIGGANRVKDEQFFTQSHFDAFAPVNHNDSSEEAKERRKKVRDRFLELNEIIFPQFSEYGLTDLHLPSNPRNYTSQYFHTPRSSKTKDALWLNYGKSMSELSSLNEPNFTKNIRIQVILKNTSNEAYIGTWLFIAKLNGSIADRQFLHEQLKSEIFLNLLYEYIIDLGGVYWITLNSDELFVGDLKNKNDLKEFLIKDDFTSYFIIGRNYQPNDIDISKEKIAETILTDFSKLYKIYDLIKYK